MGESPGILCKYGSELGNSVQSIKSQRKHSCAVSLIRVPADSTAWLYYELMCDLKPIIYCFFICKKTDYLGTKLLSPLKVDEDRGGFLHRRREV